MKRIIITIAALAALVTASTASTADVTGLTHKISVTRQGSHDLVQSTGSAFVPWSVTPVLGGSYIKLWLCRVWYSPTGNLGSETAVLGQADLEADVADQPGDTLGTIVSGYVRGKADPTRNCWDVHPDATYMRYWYGGEVLLWDWTTGIPARLCASTPIKTVYR